MLTKMFSRFFIFSFQSEVFGIFVFETIDGDTFIIRILTTISSPISTIF